jgi:RNA polymerase sigma factor (sigma-70 family)
LTLLAHVIRDVARFAHLSAEDAQDFRQTVYLKFLEGKSSVFHRFAGRSSLQTYLTVVVRRMLVDWRRTLYGKWHASSAALRLGPHAVGLDRLIHRDGCTPDEAVQILQTRSDAPSAEQMRDLATRLPARLRRTTVPETALDYISGTPFEDPIEAEERQREQTHVRQALATAIRQLPPEDRSLIELRYRQQQRVATIAQRWDESPKVLYRRCDRVLRKLRRSLESAGITHPQ